MAGEVTRICFVRHGETDWNIELRMQGHVDTSLNDNGFGQARALGRRFAGFAHVVDSPVIAALYCSDLLRARQTAQPIADALAMPLRLERDLRERNFGRCEGLTIGEIDSTFPEDGRASRRRDSDYVPPGGESRHQHQRRVLDCVERLVWAHAGQRLVVVTHGGVLDVIYRRARALPMEAPRDYPIHNTSLNWVAIAGGQWVIESWGDIAHLAAPVPRV